VREAITTVFPASAITTEKPRYNHGKTQWGKPSVLESKGEVREVKKRKLTEKLS